ncbi:MAG: FecR domain-containing protein [Nitrospirae bacterium]|nr:FecR domain-containing protein [Nitrospirota bacterium]
MVKKLIISAFLLILSVLFPIISSGDTSLGTARISLIQGDVLIQTEDTEGDWVVASINTPLKQGDRVWVPEGGRVEVQFQDGAYLRAAGGSSIDINNLTRDEEGNITQVSVAQGRVYINYKGSPVKNSVFQIDTPFSSIMAYDPSKFRVDTGEDGYTEVSAHKGSVYVEGQGGSTQVRAGSMISIGRDRFAEISPRRPNDNWDRWNIARDNRLSRQAISERYLPEELDVYASDFDNHGKWVYVQEYGYVWTPTVVVAGWAPYRIGRWVWIGGDYVWISYESWGWAPYHYGRWTFVVSAGWCWVPPLRTALYWSPGYVAWIYKPTYVAWVPLAPREVYYGYGYYGPHSVNIKNVNITNVHVNNVYVNTHVTNAVTVVHKETFITGKVVKEKIPDNPFKEAARVHPGRPDIKPTKLTALPVVKEVPKAVHPPKEIEKSKALMTERKPAVDKKVSVFKPESKPAPMPVKKFKEPKKTVEIKGVEKIAKPERPSKLKEEQPEKVSPSKKAVRKEPVRSEEQKVQPKLKEGPEKVKPSKETVRKEPAKPERQKVQPDEKENNSAVKKKVKPEVQSPDIDRAGQSKERRVKPQKPPEVKDEGVGRPSKPESARPEKSRPAPKAEEREIKPKATPEVPESEPDTQKPEIKNGDKRGGGRETNGRRGWKD